MEAIVIDAGSKLVKAGFSVPHDPPSLVIPTQMKRVPKDESTTNASLLKDATIDPVVRGFTEDWDAMEDLLCHVLYNRLGWTVGNEGNILFADPLATPKALREQVVQLLFEKFNISGFYASDQAVLSLYAVGRISGCAIDIGHGKMDIASVIEGAVHHISSKRFELGGLDLTNLFGQELRKSNPLVNFCVSDIEKLKELYVIKIGKERYTVGKALFQPSILGLELHGVVEQLFHCVSTISFKNQRRQLLENTILSGGSASIKGFENRFQKEANLSSSAIRPHLVKQPEYMLDNLEKYSAWTRGAILAKVVFPQSQHVTKADYHESGPSIVHHKCF
ncbi:actin [Handroanthus impetiginosus]|uniref:Actin n=1 Tax=Handroanthus impetiginosus TaxID=429701 RepID=A0A2G9HAB9_9LAMI|nr:actin [Handroanthus impetiginosus]